MAIAKLLSDAMDAKGWHQRKLSQASGVSQPYLSSLLAGTRTNPSSEKLFSLAQALGIDVRPLLEAAGIESENSQAVPIVVGVSGPSCSGKTWLAELIRQQRPHDVSVLDLDRYYRKLEAVEKLIHRHDNPDALDHAAIAADIRGLKSGQDVSVPKYDFATHSVVGETLIHTRRIIVVEGLFAFHNEVVRNQMDIRIWMDCPSDLRLSRRVERDTKERGRTVDEVCGRYHADVAPAYAKFIKQLRRHANLSMSSDLTKKEFVPLIVHMLMAYIDRIPISAAKSA